MNETPTQATIDAAERVEVEERQVVIVGAWDMLLAVVTSGLWIPLIWAFPTLALTDQSPPSQKG